VTATWQAIQLGPDKNPAKGTVIAEAPALAGNEIPAEIRQLWRPGEVAMCFSDARPLKKLSKESLASFRRKRLKTRLDKKFPLFADQLFNRELEQRPDHFAGVRQEIEE